MLTVENVHGISTVPRRGGHRTEASLEAHLPSIDCDPFDAMSREANDEIDDDIDELLAGSDALSSEDDADAILPSSITAPGADLYYDGSGSDSVHTCLPAASDRVAEFWPVDNTYYPEAVNDIVDEGNRDVIHDYGDTYMLIFGSETARFCSVLTLPPSPLHSLLHKVWNYMLQHFGNEPFLRHQSQAFPGNSIALAYASGVASCKKMVATVSMSAVSTDANIIISHVVYKVKVEDGRVLKLNARILTHGNEESLPHALQSDCSMCSPVSMRTIFSVAALFLWRLAKMDEQSSFRQTVQAAPDAYMAPPPEPRGRLRGILVLLTAS